jgi:hypothetical protein
MADPEAKRVVLSHDPKDATAAAAAVMGLDQERYARVAQMTDEQLSDALVEERAVSAAARIKAAPNGGQRVD